LTAKFYRFTSFLFLTLSFYTLRHLMLILQPMKSFDVPIVYRSPLISAIKKKRKENDRMKKDFSPTVLDFGPVQILLARHFGFCYGVENAIDIAFRTIEENKGKRIFLLSEMIHNPQVNADLKASGVQFLQDNSGNQIIPFESLTAEDIVLIPAFGTTLDIEKKLREIGIRVEKYNTTCPFVEKVWNRSEAIAKNQYTIIIHGKPSHEETRATFSHAAANASSVVVKDMQQTIELAKYITGEKPEAQFYIEFKNQHSAGFDVTKDLQRIGVVNQTTMLASDTQVIADYLKETMLTKYGLTEETIKERFADTRDTLCYATNDNQTAVSGMLQAEADLAIVVGGYNSSNTSHLVELCEEKLPTYFINSEEKMLSQNTILHYNFHTHMELVTDNYLPKKQPVKILLTSGASCPDALVEGVIKKLAGFYSGSIPVEEMTDQFSK
jgi:4-hydroxy-3-methylbut-2-en-1-yl diphosphate reductase